MNIIRRFFYRLWRYQLIFHDDDALSEHASLTSEDSKKVSARRLSDLELKIQRYQIGLLFAIILIMALGAFSVISLYSQTSTSRRNTRQTPSSLLIPERKIARR